MLVDEYEGLCPRALRPSLPPPPPPLPPPAPAAAAPAVTLAAGETVNAPMPGNILSVNVSQGQAVKAGDILVILEAMKMENEIVRPPRRHHRPGGHHQGCGRGDRRASDRSSVRRGFHGCIGNPVKTLE